MPSPSGFLSNHHEWDERCNDPTQSTVTDADFRARSRKLHNLESCTQPVIGNLWSPVTSEIIVRSDEERSQPNSVNSFLVVQHWASMPLHVCSLTTPYSLGCINIAQATRSTISTRHGTWNAAWTVSIWLLDSQTILACNAKGTSHDISWNLSLSCFLDPLLCILYALCYLCLFPARWAEVCYGFSMYRQGTGHLSSTKRRALDHSFARVTVKLIMEYFVVTHLSLLCQSPASLDLMIAIKSALVNVLFSVSVER